MIYLFKSRNESEDVFKPLYDYMKINHNCIRIIDEKQKDYKNILNDLSKKDVTLISSDHINISPENGYSILELIDYLKPKNFFYGIHDLAINDIGYDKKLLPKSTIILSPGEPWSSLYKEINNNIIKVGHPKFLYPKFIKTENILFAVSLIYIYAQRKIDSFEKDFNWILKNNIDLKFPNCNLSKVIINQLNNKNILSTNLSTFDIMQNYKTIISNSSSSICIESAMCGCKSINLGAKISKIYNKFNITHCSPNNLKDIDFNNLKNKIHYEYLFNIHKTISILKQ
jgi:hypothetical protein